MQRRPDELAAVAGEIVDANRYMTSGPRSPGQVSVTGPLTVSAANPRYFTAASGEGAGQRHEGDLGSDRHPIGMTMQFPVPSQTRVNQPLLDSQAEWISPGYDDEVFADGGNPMAPGSPQSRWLEDPPAADGRKVVISDTDHYAPAAATRSGPGSRSCAATTRS